MSGSLPTLGIIGAAGRMGTALVQEAGKAGMEIAEAVDAPDRSGSRNPAGGPPLSARPEGKADVYLVFCTGGAVAEHARRCAELGKPLVVGTTAMTPEDLSALEAASRAVAVVRDSNMSLGIAVMRELLRSLRPLADMGFDFEIVEEGLFTVSDVFNMPNPFTESTNFVFQLSGRADVRLRVYNLSGVEIWNASLVAEEGFNSIYWDGRDMVGGEIANGTYIYSLDVTFRDSYNRSETVNGKVVRLR